MYNAREDIRLIQIVDRWRIIMCGIAGYIGDRDCADVLIDALSKLEYRGYDSAGIAVLKMELSRWRSVKEDFPIL